MNEPTIFRVHTRGGSKHWGIAKPSSRPELGQSVSMLESNAFGWRYAQQTLEEVVGNWFKDIERIEIFKLTPA